MSSSKEKSAKKKIGRPKGSGLKYKPEDHTDKIIEWISEGKTLRDYCRQDGCPSFFVVYGWLDSDESFALRFARARDTGHDMIAQECFEIADQMPPVDNNGRTDSGYVAWQKNRIWTRTQLLAKWNPKKYGDKPAVDSDDNSAAPLNISFEVKDAKTDVKVTRGSKPE